MVGYSLLVTALTLALALILIKVECAEELDADKYLENFGYLPTPKTGSKQQQHSYAARRSAIRQFQQMAHLPKTGILDNSTVIKMKQPRCGMPDRNSSNNPNAPQSFVTYNKWNKKVLTWKVLNYSPDMPEGEQRRAFYQAFGYWSDVADIEFREVHPSSDADFKISFGAKDHGCGYPFDGVSGVLAHCFYPESGGAHFDEDELWSEDPNVGTSLRMVATHEFGHGLGLSHSDLKEALMAPFYKGYEQHHGYKLPHDDVRAIQSLYGSQRRQQ